MLHRVTLGGSGVKSADRHPKVRQAWGVGARRSIVVGTCFPRSLCCSFGCSCTCVGVGVLRALGPNPGSVNCLLSGRHSRSHVQAFCVKVFRVVRPLHEAVCARPMRVPTSTLDCRVCVAAAAAEISQLNKCLHAQRVQILSVGRFELPFVSVYLFSAPGVSLPTSLSPPPPLVPVFLSRVSVPSGHLRNISSWETAGSHHITSHALSAFASSRLATAC